jgi:hypothetical protein
VVVPERHPFRVEMRDPFGRNRVSFNASGHDCCVENAVFDWMGCVGVMQRRVNCGTKAW